MAQSDNKRVSAAEAAKLVSSEGHKYLDVRTPEEWSAGRPTGSVNVPLMLRTPEGMQPNPEFLPQVKEAFEQSVPLVVGCKAGNRSARACAMLQEHFRSVVDNAGGFDGWMEEGLPVEK